MPYLLNKYIYLKLFLKQLARLVKLNPFLHTYKASLEPEIILQEQTHYIVVDKLILAESEAAFQAAITLDLLSKLIQQHFFDEQNIKYEVFPLEGVWHLLDNEIGFKEPKNIEGKMMIKQPIILTETIFEVIKAKAMHLSDFENLKENLVITKIITEPAQKVIQILHIGPYTNEKASFQKVNSFALNNNYHLKYESHREIYLKDMRHTSKDKFETILRIPL